MNLTKLIKSAIVRAIMNDVPREDEATAKKKIQEALVKAMSPECRKLYKTNPHALRDARVASYEYGFDYSFDVIKGDAQLEPILQAYKDARDARRTAKQKLEAAIEGCRTLKQLEKALPEFKKYYPKEDAPSTNLPALANVVADLSKLGWPKNVTK